MSAHAQMLCKCGEIENGVGRAVVDFIALRNRT